MLAASFDGAVMADAKPARRKRAKKAPEPRGLTAKQVPGAEPPRKVARTN